MQCRRNALKMALAAATLFLSLGPVSAAEEQITLVKDGASEYVVVVCRDASPSERWAADDLVAHVRQMSGAALSILDEGPDVPEKAVLIGDGRAVRSLRVEIDHNRLGTDGFVIKTVGQRLVIAGGRKRGTMYGVYTLLQELGCRWWAPGASTIPSLRTVTIPPMDEEQVPVMEYRDMLYGEMNDSDEAMLFRARNKINGGFYKNMPEQYGGAWKFDTLVHSYNRLMSPGQYFSGHPEYYALIRDRRNQGQPDFSNPEVIKIMAEAIMTELAEHPEWNHVTVGQNDNNSYCQCDGCKALAEKYDSLGGMQLHFAKEVAAIVRRKYPDVDINVPAYRWSRKPPKGIKPEDKSVITLCSIECNFGQPLTEGYPKQNARFKEDLVGWSELAPKLYIWDYTTNFSHYILPYPNYYVLASNVKFFADHKVRGYMAQGSHTTSNGQFAPLCIWVLARSLWNPNADGRKLVEEFCLGYYGPEAGRFVLQYADLLHDAIAGDRIPIWCTRGTYLSAPYLSPELVARGDRLFRQAEAAVRDNPDLLKRVQTDHVPVLYVMVKRLGQMIPAAAKLTPGLSPAAVAREFSDYGRAAGISRVAEGDSAAELFDWALDFGKMKAQGQSDLPPELARAEPSTYRFLQAAQLDRRVAYLRKHPGATDGWAQNVVSPGWSITHKFSSPWDVTPGKSYKLFIRLCGTARDVSGRAIHVGVYEGPGARPCARSILCDELDGNWQAYEIGQWTASETGGSFYICLDGATMSGVSDVYLDCLWMMEVPGQ